MDFDPSPGQLVAIEKVVAWWKDPNSPQVFRLLGYAGTGKSTLYEVICQRLRDLGMRRRVTCAFTGKAANVLRKKGVYDAMTAHGAIYTPVEDDETGEITFVVNTVGPAAEADLIGVDEGSMIPEYMANDLKSFGKKILVMGDPGQLPPINGPGALMLGEPDVFLTEVHRQALDSPILRLATMARLGQVIFPHDYGQDVQVLFLDQKTQHAVYRADTQVLVGTHKVRHTITQRMRRRLGNEGPTPIAGERLICCRNDKKLGIFNGSLGVLDAVEVLDNGDLHIDATMEDLKAPLRNVWATRRPFAEHFGETFKNADRLPRGIKEFDWAYALTVHKAQGSEWPHVTVVDDSSVFGESARKHLYTAITRASEGLTLLRRKR